jgi:translocation and assembly module TamB
LFLQVLLGVCGLLLVFFLFVVFALQVPAVQQFGARKLTAFLSAKLKTKVSIGRFTTDWRNSIVLKDIYLEDQNRDTLLYAGRLGLDLNIVALKRHHLRIRSAKIENGTLQIRTSPADSTYNFGFILKSFRHKGPDSDKGLSFKLRNLKLQNVRLELSDPVRGTFARASFGNFSARLENFEPTAGAYDLGKLTLENSKLFIRQTKIPIPSRKSPKPNLTFQQLNIENLEWQYDNKPARQVLSARIGTGVLEAEKIAFPEAKVALEKLELQNAAFAFYQGKRILKYSLLVDSLQPRSATANTTGKMAEIPADWNIQVKQTNLKNLGIRYQNNNFPVKKGLDPKHLQITGLNLDLAELHYTPKRSAAKINQLKFREKSGFRIVSFTGKFKARPSVFSLYNFDLKTPASRIRSAVTVVFPPKNLNRRTSPNFNVTFANAAIGPKDLLYLAPSLAGKPFLQKLGNRPFFVSGQLSGQVNALDLRNFRVKGLTGTTLDLSGTIREFKSPENRVMNLQVRKLTTNGQDLATLLVNDRQPEKSRAVKSILQKLGNHPLILSGLLSGQINALELRGFRVKAFSGTTVDLSGTIREIRNAENRIMNLQVRKLATNRQDLETLLGNDKQPAKIRFPASLIVSGNFRISRQNLNLQNLALAASNGTALHTNGNISGGHGNTYLDLAVKELKTTRPALLEMLPAGTITPEVQLPDQIHFSGTYKGYSLKDFAVNGTFLTTFGNVQTDLKIVPVQQFSGTIALDNFHLGKVIKQEKILGVATGKASFQGKGFKVKTMELHYDADVKKFVYKKEAFRNIKIEGNLNQKIYQLNGNLSNAVLQGLGHKLKKIRPNFLKSKKNEPAQPEPEKTEPKKSFTKKIIPKPFRKKKKKEAAQNSGN